MEIRGASLLIVGLVASAMPVLAQPPSPPPSSTAIDHQGVACIIVAKYPKLKACFTSEVKEPRAYFRKQGTTPWFWVKMARNVKEAPEPNCHVGVLPKPTRGMINLHVEYYLEDVGGGSRTKEYDPLVVRTAQECKKDAPVAPISPTGPTAVFPAMPAGFTVGSFPTVAVGVATAAAAGTGVYFATKKDETPAAAPTPTPAPSVPTTPTTPPPTPTPPSTVPPLDLSCQAEPKSGVVPLTVTFTAFASGGTGSYDYSWNFGDGGTSGGRHPVHTFSSIGTFDVILTVTSGDKVKQCERFVTVNPAPTPPVSNVTLRFTSTDNARDCNGPPSVKIVPPTVDCTGTPPPGTTCSQTYAPGATVQITSSTNCGSEVCWSGACLGTPTSLGSVCTLTMDSDKTAGATFIFGTCITTAEPPVSLTWNVDLEAPGAVGQLVMDGQLMVAESGRRFQQPVRSREGEIVVSASLVRADGKPGTWRFEAEHGEAIEAGSLRVRQGEVDLLTPAAVVFRLRGEAGERVSFSYRLRR